MQKFKQLTIVLLVSVLIFSLLSCNTTKHQSVEKSKSVGCYLKEAECFIKTSCKLRTKDLALENLNNCFVWPPQNINDIDKFITENEESKKSYQEAKRITDKALKKAKGVTAPDECSKFREECIRFFKEKSREYEKGIKIASYFIELGKIKKQIFIICKNLNNPSPKNLATAMQKLRNIQKETASIENQIQSIDVPLECVEYHNSLKICLDNIYNSANEIISLIKTGDFGRTDSAYLLCNFQQKINCTDSIMAKANDNFDDKMIDLDVRSLVLADKINKELEDLSLEHFSDSDFKEPPEFYGISYR